MWVPSSLHRLIDALKKLPGIGQRSAERITYYLTRDKEVFGEIIAALQDAKEGLSFCSICHVITDVDPCPLCTDPSRENDVLIVVERPQDVFLFESLGTLKGHYHVLGGVLSPLDDVGPKDLHIDDLVDRVRKDGVKEVILAMNPTVEGETTSHFIADRLKDTDVKISRIARGLPMGSDLSLSDVVTLREALLGRRSLS
jgi:recombination protein RecR